MDVTPLTRARAADQLIRGHQGPRREGLANAVGVELFGNDKLRRLKTCKICGLLGDPGDVCGRAPDGHTLDPVLPYPTIGRR